MDERVYWGILGVVWLSCAFGSSAALAAFVRRLHPELSFYKLWAMWAIIVSLVAAAVFALDLV
jgi:hypothetical protein